MTTQTFETSKGTLLAIKLPEDATEIGFYKVTGFTPDDYVLCYYINGLLVTEFLDELSGDWKEIGLWGSVSEEKAELIVDTCWNVGWMNYVNREPGICSGIDTALESLQSLLETQIKLRNTLKQPMALPGFEDNEGYLKSKEKWKTAEAEVWKHFYLTFKSK